MQELAAELGADQQRLRAAPKFSEEVYVDSLMFSVMFSYLIVGI